MATHYRFGARQKGFGLVDILLAVIAAAIIFPGLAYFMMWHATEQREAITAQAELDLSTAAISFQSSQLAAIEAASGPSTPYVRTIAQLQAAGALSAGYNGGNPYGATFEVIWVQPSAGTLMPIIVGTGGAKIPDSELQDIALDVAAKGGEGAYISNTASTVLTCVQGTCNPVALSNYGLGAMPGKTAVALFKATQTTTDVYLHRINDGVAAHGTMSQNINMGGNSLTNAATAQFNAGNAISIGGTSYLYGDASNLATRSNTGNLYIQAGSTGATAGSIVEVNNITGSGTFSAPTLTATSQVNSNGAVVAAGNIYSTGASVVAAGNVYVGSNTAGGNNGSNASLVLQGTGCVLFVTYGGCMYMSDANYIRLNKNLYTPYTVEAGAIQSDGRMTANEFLQFNGVATAGTGCGPNGLHGRDASGAGLDCVNGIWASTGTNGAWHWVGSYLNTVYNGGNNSGHTMTVNVWGQGSSCGTQNNSYGFIASVNGLEVGAMVDFNNDYYKAGTISFPVPNGSSFQISYTNNGCNTQYTVVEYY